MQREDAWNLEKVDEAIKDLENDGTYELVLQEALTPFRGGASPIAYWSSIYGWKDGKFMRVDFQYPDFYKNRIPSIDAELKRIMNEPYSCEDSETPGNKDVELTGCLIEAHALAALSIERDKIYRLIGEDPHAGFRQALIWSKYADPDMREDAVVVFKDISDKKSLEQLKILSNDPDKGVSSMASKAIEDCKKNPPCPP